MKGLIIRLDSLDWKISFIDKGTCYIFNNCNGTEILSCTAFFRKITRDDV